MAVAAKKRKGLPKKPAFLKAYVSTASITKAARAAKIERALHYRWLADDPDYAKEFSGAQREAAQLLEDEAVRRAYEGTKKPLTYQGQFTYRKRLNKQTGKAEEYGAPLAIVEYSDALMMFLLRGFAPERYRERGSMEVSGPSGGPIALSPADPRLQALSDDELSVLIAAARKLDPVPA